MLRPLLLIMVVFAGATTSHAAQICNRSWRYHLSYDGNFPMYIRAHSGETCEATFSNVNGSNLTFKQLLLVTPPAHGKIKLGYDAGRRCRTGDWSRRATSLLVGIRKRSRTRPKALERDPRSTRSSLDGFLDMAETTIEWTDATWNPVAGCTILSPGCTNCYAMRMAARLDAMGMEKYRGLTRRSAGRAKWTGKIKLDRKVLAVPAQWRRPRRIFVNSMSDLFHESVPIEFVAEVWAVMASTPWHTYQILTKRPARMAEITSGMKKLQNVWLGTSVESSDYLDRIDELRKVQAAVRFISFEPLLGSVAGADLRGIQWVIVGGESGPRARPMLEEWVDEIEAACREADSTAFFFKQWGGVRKKATGRMYREQTFDEMPTPV